MFYCTTFSVNIFSKLNMWLCCTNSQQQLYQRKLCILCIFWLMITIGQPRLTASAQSFYYYYCYSTIHGPLPGTTWVSQYQKEHSPTHTYPDHQSSSISLLHLLWSTASPTLFNLRAWHTPPYHHYLFCCTSEIMSSNCSFSPNSLLGIPSTPMSHIHLTTLISARESAT